MVHTNDRAEKHEFRLKLASFSRMVKININLAKWRHSPPPPSPDFCGKSKVGITDNLESGCVAIDVVHILKEEFRDSDV